MLVKFDVGSVAIESVGGAVVVVSGVLLAVVDVGSEGALLFVSFTLG